MIRFYPLIHAIASIEDHIVQKDAVFAYSVAAKNLFDLEDLI